MSRYKCDECGACCKHLVIEIGWIDYQREPSLRDVTKPFKVPEGHGFEDEDGEPIEDYDPYMAGGLLACGAKNPCPKLGPDNRCAIYPTRPTDCVAMEAGGEQCQTSRKAAGLPELQPMQLQRKPS